LGWLSPAGFEAPTNRGTARRGIRLVNENGADSDSSRMRARPLRRSGRWSRTSRGYRLQEIRHDGDGAIVEDGFVGAAHGSGRDGVPVVASTFRAAKILSQLALTWTRRFAYSSSLRIGPMRPKENAMPSSEGAARMVLAVSVMVGSSMGMPVTVVAQDAWAGLHVRANLHGSRSILGSNASIGLKRCCTCR